MGFRSKRGRRVIMRNENNRHDFFPEWDDLPEETKEDIRRGLQESADGKTSYLREFNKYIQKDNKDGLIVECISGPMYDALIKTLEHVHDRIPNETTNAALRESTYETYKNAEDLFKDLDI